MIQKLKKHIVTMKQYKSTFHIDNHCSINICIHSFEHQLFIS